MSMTTSQLIERLQAQGYQITPGYLSYLLREQTILKPNERAGLLYLWQPADVDRLKAELQHRGRGPRAEGQAVRS